MFVCILLSALVLQRLRLTNSCVILLCRLSPLHSMLSQPRSTTTSPSRPAAVGTPAQLGEQVRVTHSALCFAPNYHIHTCKDMHTHACARESTTKPCTCHVLSVVTASTASVGSRTTGVQPSVASNAATIECATTNLISCTCNNSVAV